MIKKSELTEIPRILISDHSHPTVFHRLASKRAQVSGTPRLNNESTNQTQCRRITTYMILNHVTAFLLINRNVPLIFPRFARSNNRTRSGRRVRLAGRTDDHRGTTDLETRIFIFQPVGELNANTITLVTTNGHRLNCITLQSCRHRTRVKPIFLLTSRKISFLLITNFIDVLIQNIHIARVVISPLVQGDLYVDGRDFIRLGWNIPRTMSAFINLGGRFRGSKQITLA